jgi:hypothetical protein
MFMTEQIQSATIGANRDLIDRIIEVGTDILDLSPKTTDNCYLIQEPTANAYRRTEVPTPIHRARLVGVAGRIAGTDPDLRLRVIPRVDGLTSPVIVIKRDRTVTQQQQGDWPGEQPYPNIPDVSHKSLLSVLAILRYAKMQLPEATQAHK